MSFLIDRSIALILEHQSESGAYIASPSFPTYAYSWLRDGSFIAHAMDRVGQHESAARFHRWVGSVLTRYEPKLNDLTARSIAGQTIALGDQMHTRFTLDGLEAENEWTNFQLDGYGTWLWALTDHLTRTGDTTLYHGLQPQIHALVRYLVAFWQSPCYDCWEEFGDKQHIATLAALYGGIHALGTYDPTAVPPALPLAIQSFVLEHGVLDGRLVKFIGSPLVDASLLGVAVPYGLLAPNDPLMVATVAQIERDLRRGGVCRYRDDTYYGGGAWILLAAWLGWYYAEAGAYEQADALRTWVMVQADMDGLLPEQVAVNLLSPEQYQPWVDRWGPIAHPLLWSHAMLLIVDDVLLGQLNQGAKR